MVHGENRAARRLDAFGDDDDIGHLLTSDCSASTRPCRAGREADPAVVDHVDVRREHRVELVPSAVVDGHEAKQHLPLGGVSARSVRNGSPARQARDHGVDVEQHERCHQAVGVRLDDGEHLELEAGCAPIDAPEQHEAVAARRDVDVVERLEPDVGEAAEERAHGLGADDAVRADRAAAVLDRDVRGDATAEPLPIACGERGGQGLSERRRRGDRQG